MARDMSTNDTMTTSELLEGSNSNPKLPVHLQHRMRRVT